MLINASEHKWVKFLRARLHVSPEIVFIFLKIVSAFLSESLLLNKHS